MLGALLAAGQVASQTHDQPGDPTRGLDPVPVMPSLQPARPCPDPCTNYVPAD
jgi:hypothetical protein